MKNLLFIAIAALFIACNEEAVTPDFGLPSDLFKAEPTLSQRAPLPKVYMRLVNQTQANGITKYDVEFRADNPGTRLTGMNVRIWMPANQFGWVGMTDFAPGYAASAPNPAQVMTGGSSSGPMIFGFPGAARYVNGAMQLVNPSQPAVLLNTWVKLFAVQLAGVPPCPIVILDKEINPAAGGFYINDGITISCSTNGGMPYAVDEYVNYIGWQQTSNSMPFGAPIQCN